MATFGEETAKGSYITIEDYIRACLFTCPTSGKADQISVLLNGTTYNGKIMCALYDSSKNLIAVTEERENLAIGSEVWYDFTFASPPDLIGGNSYYLAVYCETTAQSCQVQRGSAGAAVDQFVTRGPYTYNSNFPDPLGGTDSTYILSIHCDYTEVSIKAWLELV
jgi:hypothetical protein